MKGFALIEFLIVIVILVILAALFLAGFRSFQGTTSLEESANQAISCLRLAQNKTLSSEGESSYGVHFATTSYVLFTGSSYSPSSPTNEIHNLPNNIEISNISLANAAEEVTFDKLSGRTSQYGQVSVWLVSDHSQVKSIYIKSSGQVGLTDQSVSLTGRLIDSRHVHFDYSRAIDVGGGEKATLSFNNSPNPTVTQDIVIKDNLDTNGQLDWQGTVTVGGAGQTIEIKTHQLNNPTTTFSVNRDRRYNTKPLSIFLSGDPGNSLIDYTATGTTTRGASPWVSDPQLQ